MEQLDVEGEAVDQALAEHEGGHVGAEPLEAALGVAVVAEEDGLGEQVDDPSTELPQAAGPYQGDGVGVATAPDGDVPALLDPLEQRPTGGRGRRPGRRR